MPSCLLPLAAADDWDSDGYGAACYRASDADPVPDYVPEPRRPVRFWRRKSQEDLGRAADWT